MVTKLHNLTESIERKYQLTEAFNDSFPGWLKDRLVTVRQWGGDQGWKNKSNFSKVPREERPSFISPRGYYGSTADLGLFMGMLNATDLQNVQVIEGPIPEKRTDPRLQEPNIPIWGFPNGQVYIPGMNDNEESQQGAIEDGRIKAFKYIPFKALQSSAVNFAYIDGSKMPESPVQAKRADRLKTARELMSIPNYERQGSSNGSRFTTGKGWRDKVDKSGYIISPDRYAEKLKELKAGKYVQILQQRYYELVEYKDDISAAMQYYDPFTESDEFNKLKRMLSYLTDAISTYNYYAKRIEEIANDPDYDESSKRTYISKYIDNLLNDYDFRQLKALADDTLLGSADWLV